MQIQDSVALVTGANRGLGREFVSQLRERGARRVYAASRDATAIEIDGVEPLQLDVTDAGQVAAAAARADDVTLLVNNAGISTHTRMTDGDLAAIHREMDTNFYGTLATIRAFAPVLGANGGGAILDMLSVLSWLQFPQDGSYGASKAAAWALTDAARIELGTQGTLVTGLHVGAVDTEMMADYDGPKVAPADVVAAGLDGIASGAAEVLADESARLAKASLTDDPRERYAHLAR